MPAIECLPPCQRADALDGVAIISTGVDPETARIAKTLAAALRDAELMQGQLHDHFKDA